MLQAMRGTDKTHKRRRYAQIRPESLFLAHMQNSNCVGNPIRCPLIVVKYLYIFLWKVAQNYSRKIFLFEDFSVEHIKNILKDIKRNLAAIFIDTLLTGVCNPAIPGAPYIFIGTDWLYPKEQS